MYQVKMRQTIQIETQNQSTNLISSIFFILFVYQILLVYQKLGPIPIMFTSFTLYCLHSNWQILDVWGC
uniref:Putative ovule protein n=1 Tax=Solanum chacoense TaxID=4108 RepID=A0A0V0GWN0_SOLCH